MSVKCPKCESDNTDTASFCSDCGTQIRSPQEIPAVTKTLETPFPQFPPGTSLADRYEIIRELGKGGMGEVYLAEDTNLKRQVAIKVLPQKFALDKERLARFEREARLLASLNHPNIATIHGFEKSDGQQFLVMELVEGDTLAERINKSPMPLDEALEICHQISEGLESAHEKGIIHRDLKPANIKVTPEGKVKILDYGIAKAFQGQLDDSDSSQSATITDEITRPGMILGTAAYMSPEQAKGKAVDKQTDIWAFGCILYECLTGNRAFGGETISETLASILKDDLDVKALHSRTPWNIMNLLNRCLAKDLRERLHDISDARIEIDQAIREPQTFVYPKHDAAKGIGWKLTMILILAALAIGAVITGLLMWSLRPGVTPRQASRFSIVLPQDQRFTSLGRHSVALSPDGKFLVYSANNQLYMRPLNQLQLISIQGTEGISASVNEARNPIFSPDGKWVGYFADYTLRKIPINGGMPIDLCECSHPPFGASWEMDDTIVFGQGAEGIWRVPASGGTPEVLIKVDSSKDEIAHGPQMLPQRNHVLYTLNTGSVWDEAQIVVQSIESSDRKILIDKGTDARYVATGHIVYAKAGAIWAVPFDVNRLELTGDEVLLPIKGVHQSPPTAGTGTAQFCISPFGTFAYIPRSETVSTRNLVWVDRKGKQELLTELGGVYNRPRISPDGKRVVVEQRIGDNSSIWIYELNRKVPSRLTIDSSDNFWPVWMPDGERIIFSSHRRGDSGTLFLMSSTGGEPQQLTESGAQYSPTISPDGKIIAFHDKDLPRDIWTMPVEGKQKPQIFVQSEFDESHPMFSPDGRWIAYASNSPGKMQIFVKQYPDGITRQITSSGRNQYPVWSADGDELFFVNQSEGIPLRMMVVSIKTDPHLSWSDPKMLFEGTYLMLTDTRNYDIHPNGQRFLLVGEIDQEVDDQQINIIINWFDELKRLVPTGK